MMNEVEDCRRIVKDEFQKPLNMTVQNEIDFQNSTVCHICERKFNEQATKSEVR